MSRLTKRRFPHHSLPQGGEGCLWQSHGGWAGLTSPFFLPRCCSLLPPPTSTAVPLHPGLARGARALPLNLPLQRAASATPERHYPADAPWEGERWGGFRCVYKSDLSLIKTFACILPAPGRCTRAALGTTRRGLSCTRSRFNAGTSHPPVNRVLSRDTPWGPSAVP